MKNREWLKPVLLTLLLLTLIAAGFAFYAGVVRTKTEPITFADRTNTDSAVYPLKSLMAKLYKQKNLYPYVFPGRSDEPEYGTYVIPGLKATKTLESGNQEPVICGSMTPQGIAVTEEYILVSAYCNTKQHNSVIYVIDKETHKFRKKIVLKGKPHVGGLAYDPEHQVIWVSGRKDGVAQANSFTLEQLEEYHFERDQEPIEYAQVCPLTSIDRNSFMTYNEGFLYVGCFEEYLSDDMSTMEKYEIDGQGRLDVKEDVASGKGELTVYPVETAVLAGRVQGMAFYKDYILLSESSGFRKSDLVIFDNTSKVVTFSNENSATHMSLPPQMEEICTDGDDLYVVFESAAYAYRSYIPVKIDRILKMDLKKMPIDETRERLFLR